MPVICDKSHPCLCLKLEIPRKPPIRLLIGGDPTLRGTPIFGIYLLGNERTVILESDSKRKFRVIAKQSLLALLLPVVATSDIQTTTQTISANISPYGKLSVPASITLRAADSRFGGNLAGSLTVSYWARTSTAGGSSLTVQASSDFSPSGGPSISDVTYLCSGSTLGAGCSGNQALTISTQTAVVALPSGACTGGGSACSTTEPNTVLLTLSAPDKPRYKTGAYSAQITFTISTL